MEEIKQKIIAVINEDGYCPYIEGQENLTSNDWREISNTIGDDIQYDKKGITISTKWGKNHFTVHWTRPYTLDDTAYIRQGDEVVKGTVREHLQYFINESKKPFLVESAKKVLDVGNGTTNFHSQIYLPSDYDGNEYDGWMPIDYEYIYLDMDEAEILPF